MASIPTLGDAGLVRLLHRECGLSASRDQAQETMSERKARLDHEVDEIVRQDALPGHLYFRFVAVSPDESQSIVFVGFAEFLRDELQGA